MNIIVDETPVIPYEVYRRYVSGSASAKVTLCGDVIGPIFPDGEPVDFMSMFAGSNHGRVWDLISFILGANRYIFVQIKFQLLFLIEKTSNLIIF